MKHPVSCRTQHFLISLKAAYIEANLPKRLCYYVVIVWLNTASPEEDQHLILHHCLFSPQFDTGFSDRLKLKDDAVPTILHPTVMSHHTSVSTCFNYVVTIALSVITDRLICTEYLYISNLNHNIYGPVPNGTLHVHLQSKQHYITKVWKNALTVR